MLILIKIRIIIIIAPHEIRWMIYTMTSVYKWQNGSVKWVRRFKVPAKANHTMEAYSQTMCTWVGHKAGEWNGCGWYDKNESDIEVWKLGRNSQRSDVKCLQPPNDWFQPSASMSYEMQKSITYSQIRYCSAGTSPADFSVDNIYHLLSFYFFIITHLVLWLVGLPYPKWK